MSFLNYTLLTVERWVFYKSFINTKFTYSNKPHKISGELIVSSTIKIEFFACSCTADVSESCKHVVAVLLFLNRNHNNYHKHISFFLSKCIVISLISNINKLELFH